MSEPRTYKCAWCGNEYEHLDESDWSEADAIAETKENFPGVSGEHCEVICDDCYVLLKEQMRQRQEPEPR